MTRLLLIPAILFASFIGLASTAHAGSHELTVRGIDVYGDYLRLKRTKYNRYMKKARAARTQKTRGKYLAAAAKQKRWFQEKLAVAKRLPATSIVWHGDGGGIDLGQMYSFLRKNKGRFGKRWHLYGWKGKSKISTMSPESRVRMEKSQARSRARSIARNAKSRARARARLDRIRRAAQQRAASRKARSSKKRGTALSPGFIPQTFEPGGKRHIGRTSIFGF